MVVVVFKNGTVRQMSTSEYMRVDLSTVDYMYNI